MTCLFDRLVDGELSAAERRELLASLDGRPTGWRRCALAFLEAQTWQNELGRLVREKPATVVDSNRSTEDRTQFFTRSTVRLFAGRPVTTWFALAASVMFAFTLGLALRISPSPTPLRRQTLLISQSRAAVDGKSVWQSGQTRCRARCGHRDEAGKPQQLRVPLVDASTMDRQMGLRFQSGVSSKVRNQLEQNGYQVETTAALCADCFLATGGG